VGKARIFATANAVMQIFDPLILLIGIFPEHLNNIFRSFVNFF
jgi:hypothetical protein